MCIEVAHHAVVMLCYVIVAREKVTAIVNSMKTLCLRDILWNRLLWSEEEYEARRRRRTGEEDFRDPVSDTFCRRKLNKLTLDNAAMNSV